MGILNTFREILNHPLNKNQRIKSLLRFVSWQFGSRLIKYPIIYNLTGNSKIVVSKGLTGATGNLYCGLLEFDDMMFLLHFLRAEDLFYDIGSNVGVYTVLASAEIGCKSIAIEPVPSTYNKLCGNLSLNCIDSHVQALNIGIGSSLSKLEFTSDQDSMNHVAFDNDPNNIVVNVNTLDNIAYENTPNLIKIDVEGFESEVINGGNNTFSDKNLKAIIIELNGSGSRYGYVDIEIHKKLINYGFKPYSYFPFDRKLIELSSFGRHNTIYIRDFAFVVERIKNARKIKVGTYTQLI